MWIVDLLSTTTGSVLDLLNFVQVHAALDNFSNSTTMETFTPVPYKTVKIHKIEHTPENQTTIGRNPVVQGCIE